MFEKDHDKMRETRGGLKRDKSEGAKLTVELTYTSPYVELQNVMKMALVLVRIVLKLFSFTGKHYSITFIPQPSILISS